MRTEKEMIINFSPTRDDRRPVFKRCGDTLLIDGEQFDFEPVFEGSILPASAIHSEWICDDVTRKEGILYVTLKLCHGADAPDAVRFPQPVSILQDGPIPLPVSDGFDAQEKVNNV